MILRLGFDVIVNVIQKSSKLKIHGRFKIMILSLPIFFTDTALQFRVNSVVNLYSKLAFKLLEKRIFSNNFNLNTHIYVWTAQFLCAKFVHFKKNICNHLGNHSNRMLCLTFIDSVVAISLYAKFNAPNTHNLNLIISATIYWY